MSDHQHGSAERVLSDDRNKSAALRKIEAVEIDHSALRRADGSMFSRFCALSRFSRIARAASAIALFVATALVANAPSFPSKSVIIPPASGTMQTNGAMSQR